MKKGQGLSVTTMVLIALGLIALTILSIILYQSTTRGASKYQELGEQAIIKEGECKSIVLQRDCWEECKADMGLREVYSPVGWKDCADFTDREHCCEKVYT